MPTESDGATIRPSLGYHVRYTLAVAPVVAVVAVVAALELDRPIWVAVVVTIGVCATGLAGASLLYRRCEVTADAVRLIVRSRFATHELAWSDVGEVEWHDDSALFRAYLYRPAWLAITPLGGPFDDPGPNNPIYAPMILTRPERDAERERVKYVCERAGVKFAQVRQS